MTRVNQNFRTLFWMLAGVALLLATSIGAVSQEDEARAATPRIGAISGRVVNENGQPIPHALVFVGSPLDGMQSRTSTTDDRARFQVSSLDTDLYAQRLSAGYYYPLAIRIVCPGIIASATQERSA